GQSPSAWRAAGRGGPGAPRRVTGRTPERRATAPARAEGAWRRGGASPPTPVISAPRRSLTARHRVDRPRDAVHRRDYRDSGGGARGRAGRTGRRDPTDRGRRGVVAAAALAAGCRSIYGSGDASLRPGDKIPSPRRNTGPQFQ